MALTQVAAFTIDDASVNSITLPFNSGAGSVVQPGDLLVFSIQWANNGTAAPSLTWGGTTGTGYSYGVPWSSPSAGSISSGVASWVYQSGVTSLQWTFGGAADDVNIEVLILRDWTDFDFVTQAWSAASETGSPPSRSTPTISSIPAGSLVYAGIDMASGSEAVTAVGGTVILDGPERNGIVASYGATVSEGTVSAKQFTWPTSGAYRVRTWALAVHPAATPSVVYGNVGRVTDDGFSVAVKALNATNVAIRVGASTGDAVALSNGWAVASIDGLNPSTTYDYDIILDGTEEFNDWGTTKTFPAPGTPTSFGFALGSCFNPTTISGTTTGPFDRIQARNPLLWIHGGDFHYEDNASTSVASHIADMEKSLAYSTRLTNLMRDVPTLYSPGDHDYGGNNVFAGAWTPATRDAKLAVMPFYDRPDPTALYHSVIVGRVRFIMLDTRSKAVEDTTRLGSTQLSWLEDQLLESEPVKLVWVDNSWIDTRPSDPGDDTWEHFDAERTTIAGYIENAVGQVVILHGDQHAIAIDDGTGNDWGGVPVVGGGPYKQLSSIKVANISDYSEGIYPTTENVGVEQYVWCDVTDDGSTITLDFSGRDSSDVERMGLLVEVEAGEDFPTTGTVTVTSTVVGSMTKQTTASGDVVATSGVSGSLTKQTSASGDVEVVSGVSGSVAKNVTASGVVVVTSGASGAAVKRSQAQGTVTASSAVTGSLTKQTSAGGDAVVTSTVTGELTKHTTASGTVIVVSGASGSAVLGGSESGTVVVTSTVSGSLTRNTTASGTVVVTSGVSGSAEVEGALSGTIQVTSGVSGHMTKQTVATGAVVVVSALTGEVTANYVGLGGAVEILSGISGTMLPEFIPDLPVRRDIALRPEPRDIVLRGERRDIALR